MIEANWYMRWSRLSRRIPDVPVEHVGDHLNFGLSGSNLLCRGHLGGTAEKERHDGYRDGCMGVMFDST